VGSIPRLTRLGANMITLGDRINAASVVAFYPC
jgi:hypothetical protein